MKLTRLLFIALLSLTSLQVQAEIKAGYIDSQLILQQAPQAIKAVEEMQKEFKDREQALRTAAEAVQKQEQNLQKDGAIMSPDQRKKVEEEILEKKRKIRFDAQSLKEDVDLRKKQEIQKLRETITGVIKDYAKRNGFDFIFTEGVAYAADKVNVTEDILKELQK